jgi:hypothetical protein
MPTVFSYPLVSPFSATQHTLLGCDAVTGEVHRYDLSNLDTLVPIASQAEAEAGTNNAKMMTPLRTAQAIAASSFVKADGTVSMTGQLTLPAANPTNANHAARKAYVDAGDVWIRLADAAVSNVTTIDLTGFSLQDYRQVTVMLLGARVSSSSSTNILGRVFRNGSVVTTAYTYRREDVTSSLVVSTQSGSAQIFLTSDGINTDYIATAVELVQSEENGKILFFARTVYTNSSGVLVSYRAGGYQETGTGWVDGFRIIAPNAFQNNVGRVVVMGLRN